MKPQMGLFLRLVLAVPVAFLFFWLGILVPVAGLLWGIGFIITFPISYLIAFMTVNRLVCYFEARRSTSSVPHY